MKDKLNKTDIVELTDIYNVVKDIKGGDQCVYGSEIWWVIVKTNL